MKPIERLQLIERIACELQERMSTSDINAYLPAFDISFEWRSACGSKRLYVKEILTRVNDATLIDLTRDLELAWSAHADHPARALADFLSTNGAATCREDFTRAIDAIAADPSSAVGLACTTMESICKAILDDLSAPYPADESLQPLMKEVTRRLNLSPDGHADGDIKRVLGGLVNVAAGLAILRTKYSTFHGVGKRQYRLGTRHARLAVNALAAAGQFLLETYAERSRADQFAT